MLSIPSTSVQYVHVPITGTDLDGGEPVAMAVIATTAEEPATGDWKTANWDAGSARILIGPGTDLQLADGIYRVWVRVTASPEIPVIRSGLLRIT